MNGYLLDTCILSILRKKKTPEILTLKEKIRKNMEDYSICALTIGEIRFGIDKLMDPQIRVALQSWLLEELIPSFDHRILPIDSTTCMIWGSMSAEASKKGITIPVSDGLIAATAIQHHMILITENTRHFLPTGAHLLDLESLAKNS